MGKDNIVFHSVIWPGILLGANGQGAVGGEIKPALGELQLPTEVVSSEFMTMRGSKVSSSRGASIFVGDFLDEFGRLVISSRKSKVAIVRHRWKQSGTPFRPLTKQKSELL